MSIQINEKFSREALILLYINQNSYFYPKVHSKLFEDRFLQKFYSLCARFYKKFNTTIFDSTNKSEAQIVQFIHKNKELAVYDQKLSYEENVGMFMDNVRLVFSYNLSNYATQTLEHTFAIWFKVRSSYVHIVEGVEYLKKSQAMMSEYSLDEIATELQKVRHIMNGGFDATIDDDIGMSILDRMLHVQPDANNLFHCGWHVIDRWNSGQDEGKGGFEPGTLTYILGAPNSGKSVFLWNMAYLFWYYGANIAGASLEMSGNKIAKRIGARMFGVDIGQYSKFASDEVAFNSAVSKFKANMNEDNVMQTAPGDLRIRRFGKATVADLRVFVDRIEQKTGQKLNGLVLDYATELANASGLSGEKMYSYHKENCNDLYELAVESDIFVLTAHQLHVRYKGLDDVTLQMISESSAITQRPDMIYGTIHSDAMKQENKFEMKLLKGRDTGGVGDRTSFEIDWKHMNLTAKNNIIDTAIIH